MTGCLIQGVAKELRLDRHTVKTLEQQYMQEQLRRAGTPGPGVIGLDEVSIKKGHTYRLVVSDLVRHRPVWRPCPSVAFDLSHLTPPGPGSWQFARPASDRSAWI